MTAALPTDPASADAPARSDRAALLAPISRLSLIAGLAVAVPLAMSTLTESQFALYVLVTQLAPLLVFADLGIGNGLITLLARTKDAHERASLVSSALAAVGALACATGAAAVLATLLPWNSLLGLDVSTAEATTAVTVFVAVLALGMPLALVEKAALGLHDAPRYYACQSVAGVLIAAGSAACWVLDASTAWFVAAVAAGPVVANAVALGVIRHRHPSVRPARALVTRARARQLLRLGGGFFVLGVSGAIAYESAVVVVSWELTDTAVAAFFVALRIASVPIMLIGVSYVPLWPRISAAHAANDTNAMRAAVRHVMRRGTAVATAAAIAYVLVGPHVARLWASVPVETPRTLYVLLALWIVLNAVSGPLAMLLNGAHVIAFQIACALGAALAMVPSAVQLTRTTGIEGPVAAMLLVQLLFVTAPAWVYARRRRWL